MAGCITKGELEISHMAFDQEKNFILLAYVSKGKHICFESDIESKSWLL
jgi:hypothetical protein